MNRMGDYLSDLVTRNIGTANIIKPRRAAHFETIKMPNPSESPAAPSFSQTEDFDETFTAEYTPAPSRRPRQVKLKEDGEATAIRKDSDERITRVLYVSPPENYSPPIDRDVAHPAFPSEVIETRQQPAHRKTSSPNSPKVNFSKPVAPEPVPLQSGEIREKSNDLIEQAIVQTRSETALPKTSEVRIARSEPPAPKIESKIPPPQISAPPLVEVQTSIVVKPRVEKITNRVSETTIRPKISPARREKTAEQTSGQISDGALPPESPTINVTIGRVEIRAVVSSTNTAPVGAKSAKPLMSLDDYLQKQNAGGRR